MEKYQVYQMPTGRYYDEQMRLFEKLKADDRYQYARGCIHCTDTADSFNRYVSTYCHARQEHIAGALEDKLGRCNTCEMYVSR